jgi:hypothetical protein
VREEGFAPYDPAPAWTSRCPAWGRRTRHGVGCTDRTGLAGCGTAIFWDAGSGTRAQPSRDVGVCCPWWPGCPESARGKVGGSRVSCRACGRSATPGRAAHPPSRGRLADHERAARERRSTGCGRGRGVAPNRSLTSNATSKCPQAASPSHVVAATLKPPPKKLGVTYWSSRLLARQEGVSHTRIARIW